MYWACPSCVGSGYPLQVRPRATQPHSGLSATIPHAKKSFATEAQGHSFFSVAHEFFSDEN